MVGGGEVQQGFPEQMGQGASIVIFDLGGCGVYGWGGMGGAIGIP